MHITNICQDHEERNLMLFCSSSATERSFLYGASVCAVSVLLEGYLFHLFRGVVLSRSSSLNSVVLVFFFAGEMQRRKWMWPLTAFIELSTCKNIMFVARCMQTFLWTMSNIIFDYLTLHIPVPAAPCKRIDLVKRASTNANSFERVCSRMKYVDNANNVKTEVRDSFFPPSTVEVGAIVISLWIYLVKEASDSWHQWDAYGFYMVSSGSFSVKEYWSSQLVVAPAFSIRSNSYAFAAQYIPSLMAIGGIVNSWSFNCLRYCHCIRTISSTIGCSGWDFAHWCLLHAWSHFNLRNTVVAT